MPSANITDGGEPKKPPSVFLFSNPRTGSNLLMRLLSKQERFVQSDFYFYGSKMAMNEDLFAYPGSEVPQNLRDVSRDKLQGAFDKLQQNMKDTESLGKVLFVKEQVVLLSNPSLDFPNSYPCDPSFWTLLMQGETERRISTNPTLFPDDFLETWLPIFLIRHPALVLSSLLRAQMKLLGPNMRIALFERFAHVIMRPQRQLYDWFVARRSRLKEADPVLVIDADDVMHNRPAMEKLCTLTGMDADTLQYEWEAKTSEELERMTPASAIFLGTLVESRGVVEGKDSQGLDLVVEREKWVAEFGEERADRLEERAKDVMDDYDYLRQRRLTAD